MDSNQELPEFSEAPEGYLKYRWADASLDFAYPLSVTASLYRVADIAQILERNAFRNPNTMEATMASSANVFKATKPCSLCFPVSVAFSNPVNRVQDTFVNRAGTRVCYAVDRLDRLFDMGCRVDSNAYMGVDPRSAHAEFELCLRVIPDVAMREQAGLACDGAHNVEAGMICVEPVYDEAYYADRLSYLANPIRHQANVTTLVTAYRGLYGTLPSSVLELGCGLGTSVSMLRLLGVEAVGTEASDYLLSGPLAGNPYIVRPVGYAVPLAPRSFDAVFSTDFLEHFPCDQARKVVAEHLRLARNLVYAIICFPENHSPRDDLYHLCLKPKSWWKEQFIGLGARIVGESPYGLLVVPPSEKEDRGDSESRDPVVSVVIPCYNQGGFLADAVRSVMEQTYRSWEIVIVNDGSTDDTDEVVKRLARELPDERLTYVKQPNFGLPIARNAGIQRARGRYILPLDADDRISPTFLEETVYILEHFPEFGIVYTHLREFGEANGVWDCPPWDPERLSYENLLPYASLYRREVWESVGGYDPSMRDGYEDWEFWINAAAHGWKATCIPKRLFWYRRRQDSMMFQARRKHAQLVRRIQEKHAAWYHELRTNLDRVGAGKSLPRIGGRTRSGGNKP